MLFNTDYNYNNIHKLSHMFSGYVLLAIYNHSDTVKFKVLSILVLLGILVYQFGQYFFNIRIFLDLLEVKSGNSLAHTFNKLGDYIIGVLIYLVINHKRYDKSNFKSE
mgnify:CR=1 FL=1